MAALKCYKFLTFGLLILRLFYDRQSIIYQINQERAQRHRLHLLDNEV